MAGALKPDNVGPEAAYQILAGSVYGGGTGTGLFDGVNNIGSNANSGYFSDTNAYLELQVSQSFNIWTIGLYGPAVQPLDVKKWNGSAYVDYATMPKGSTDSTWNRDLSGMPAGQYRFATLSGARDDSEWFIEISHPIRFMYKKLNGDICYHNGSAWVVFGQNPPTNEEFIQYGMSQVATVAQLQALSSTTIECLRYETAQPTQTSTALTATGIRSSATVAVSGILDIMQMEVK